MKNSVNCHEKVMEFYNQISVGTLIIYYDNANNFRMIEQLEDLDETGVMIYAPRYYRHTTTSYNIARYL